jgi:DNA modification methylase
MTIVILQGDVRGRLAELPSDSFDCIVTSPPYWGLRDYGVACQIGLEPTLTEYLDTIVAVCRELRRVLKPSGTFWLNVGDSYCSTDKWGGGGNTGKQTVADDGSVPSWAVRHKKQKQEGLKPKDLCMVPNRLAIRLQEDGWYVRSEIIWHKPNPMPESVTDRPTSSHEKIWLLTKNERYAYEADAIAEPSNYPPGCGWADAGHEIAVKTAASKNPAFRAIKETRNARNVWTIATQPYSEAHFATFPPELAERCVKAGCPVGGHVLDPFGGAGTTGLVADRLGRDATLIELNPSYVEIARERLRADAGMFTELV